jgi:hypothetical protein
VSAVFPFIYSIFHHQPFSYIDHILKPEIRELKLILVEHYVIIDNRVSEVYAASRLQSVKDMHQMSTRSYL